MDWRAPPGADRGRRRGAGPPRRLPQQAEGAGLAHALTPARAEDEPDVVALTRDAYTPYVELLGYPPLPMSEDYAPRIAAGEVWLLRRAEALAGLIVLERHPDHAMIYSVAVAPAHHGQGIGSALLDFAETQARAWAVPEIRLYTNAKMLRNQAIYAGRGYRETARREIPHRPGFFVVDMVKRL